MGWEPEMLSAMPRGSESVMAWLLVSAMELVSELTSEWESVSDSD